MTSNSVLFYYRSKLGPNLHLQPSLLEFEDVINTKNFVFCIKHQYTCTIYLLFNMYLPLVFSPLSFLELRPIFPAIF